MRSYSNRTYFACLITVLLFFTGCQTTQYVPANSYLLSRVRIVVDKKDFDKNELKTYLKQKPNTRIFGFWRFHLGLYNLSDQTRENGWLKRIGEAPVIYDPNLTTRTREELKRYFQNKGYYQAVVRDTTLFKPNKMAEVNYYVETRQPFLIKSYQEVINDDSLRQFFKQPDPEMLVKPESYFDVDLLNKESQRLLRKFQNQGFYKATKSAIYYEADSAGLDHGVKVKLVVEKEAYLDSISGISRRNHEKFVFRNFYYLTDREVQGSLFTGTNAVDDVKRDTLVMGAHYFINREGRRIKPSLLINANHLTDRRFYSAELVERTYNEFFATRQFKLVNIRFVETGKLDASGNPMLDTYFLLTPGLSQSYSASVEATNSLGNFGVAGNLGYQHKNLFRGGEIFDIQFTAGTQKQSWGGSSDTSTVFHSSETGVDARLTIPKFITPILKTNFFKYSTPQTFFNLSYNYQKTPDYTRTIARSAFGYQWKSSDYTTHRVNLLDLNFVRMFALDSSFLSSIRNLYIKSSYVDHSITAFNYAYTYSTQTQKKADYLVLKSDIETAGNLLHGIGIVLNRPKFESSDGKLKQYYFLNTPYAQYVKLDLEVRKCWMLDKRSGFAIRGYGGAALAYGNSDQIPFERKFFSGGTNGIRAWPIRTLGPGSYQSDPTEFPNQSGDLKLEANAEYRFGIFGSLEGAWFCDLGNIWSFNDNRPGTEFKLNRFYKEIAVCSGAGIRYDFTYVIFRLDLGLRIHDPALSEGKRWIEPSEYLRKRNMNVVFAIGYPF